MIDRLSKMLQRMTNIISLRDLNTYSASSLRIKKHSFRKMFSNKNKAESFSSYRARAYSTN